MTRQQHGRPKQKRRIGRRKSRWGLFTGALLVLLYGFYEFPSSLEKAEALQNEKVLVNEKAAHPASSTSGKVVYLTFDDGPSDLTNQFLDVLKEKGVKSTFFMQGRNLEREKLHSVVKRASLEGHYIGGHSMTHVYKTLYEEGQFVNEMKQTLSLIRDITGKSPHLVRPPYGSAPGLSDKKIRDQLAAAKIKVWDWTIDSNDWNLSGRPEEILTTIKKTTKRKTEIVLLHEKPQTLKVLPDIIDFYKKQGYTFGVYDDAKHFPLNFTKDERL
ncbi:polysaccharide deacetylase family protein [Paenibacillus chitinolyticus]|uniref:polysaccharide deacetylase family protein n=1 Tax=Paenibacillus chitinolyticus TaxID=79263 RepID=UPI00387076C7